MTATEPIPRLLRIAKWGFIMSRLIWFSVRVLPTLVWAKFHAQDNSRVTLLCDDSVVYTWMEPDWQLLLWQRQNNDIAKMISCHISKPRWQWWWDWSHSHISEIAEDPKHLFGGAICMLANINCFWQAATSWGMWYLWTSKESHCAKPKESLEVIACHAY